jgi:hypothetical protein
MALDAHGDAASAAAAARNDAGSGVPTPAAARPAPATELQLLCAFLEALHTAGPSASGPAAPPYVAWEALLAAPGLAELLEAAAARDARLTASLRLAGLLPPVAGPAAEPQLGAPAAGAADEAGQGLLPQLRAVEQDALEAALRALASPADGAPLDAAERLTAAVTSPSSGAASSDLRAAAARWMAASALRQAAAQQLGCAEAGLEPAGAASVTLVAVLRLLGLPLEPAALHRAEELQVKGRVRRSRAAHAQLCAPCLAVPCGAGR